MIKSLMAGAGLAPLAVVGLVTFVVVFVGIAAWALTRSGRTVADWSSLPLSDGPRPVTPRDPLAIVTADKKAGGCGKCGNCTC